MMMMINPPATTLTDSGSRPSSVFFLGDEPDQCIFSVKFIFGSASREESFGLDDANLVIRDWGA